MIVPNYVPDPLEVPGNVADEPHFVRIAFIRRVTMLHLASVAILGALAGLPWPQVDFLVALGPLVAVLITLDFWRIWQRGRRVEASLSAGLLPVVLTLGGWAAHEGLQRGLPVGELVAGLICAGIYTGLCGRDFSFVGCATLSAICSTVALAAFSVNAGFTARQAAAALAANAAYLVYFEYDLASLMSRRRRGEELAAVVDLYRDVFNVFGYAVRLVRHWKKHKIWVQP